jgi:hypothetical protein
MNQRLDEAMDLPHANGISVDLATPTSAPRSSFNEWLMSLLVDARKFASRLSVRRVFS